MSCIQSAIPPIETKTPKHKQQFITTESARKDQLNASNNMKSILAPLALAAARKQFPEIMGQHAYLTDTRTGGGDLGSYNATVGVARAIIAQSGQNPDDRPSPVGMFGDFHPDAPSAAYDLIAFVRGSEEISMPHQDELKEFAIANPLRCWVAAFCTEAGPL